MKRKFSSNSELCKVFAQQTQTHGTGNNMFFEYQTIYSYGYHYEIAQIIEAPNGEKIAFVNSNTYSNTTSKHTYHVLRALNIRDFFIPFTISGNMFTRADYFKISDLPQIIKVMKNKVATTLKRQSLAKSKIFHFDDASRQIDEINIICKMFDLPLIDREDILYYKEAKERVNTINSKKIDKGAEMVNSLYEYFRG